MSSALEMKGIIPSVCILLSLAYHSSANCGPGWIAYGDIKCYKVLDDFVGKDAADVLCDQEDPASNSALLMIMTLGEQEFVRSLIFDQLGLFDNFWLGATRFNATTFAWKDGTRVVYANWDVGYPSSEVAMGCLQLTSSVARQSDSGLWRDVPCTKRNIPICQKDPQISIEKLHQQVLKLQNNPVPIGFIYTEYPGKPGPNNIWPGVVWTEVTTQYAGLFFRAAGGGAANFNVTQAENASRLKSVDYATATGGTPYAETLTLPATGKSNFVTVGGHAGNNTLTEGLRFELTGGEVRPKNQAVRMWERIA